MISIFKKSEEQTKAKSIGIHTSIETLLQKNFITIINTGDLRYLLHDINDEVPDNAMDIWDEIVEQHYLLTSDKSSKNTFRKLLSIDELSKKKEWAVMLLNLIIRGNQTIDNFKLTKKQLAIRGFVIRDNKPIISEVERIQKQIKALDALIRLKRDELPKQEKREQVKFQKEWAKLKLHYKIDVDSETCTVVQWHYILEGIREMNKETTEA